MEEFTYEGFRIEPTMAGNRELAHHGYSLHYVKRILEEGYDCSSSRRKANIREKCVREKDKEMKVVVALTTPRYLDGYIETVWRLIHFGVVSYKRRK